MKQQDASPQLARLYYRHPSYLRSERNDFPSHPISYFGFGRQALQEALKRCDVKAGSVVLIPEFICRDVLSSIQSLGAKVTYYPIDQNLKPATPPNQWPQAQVVLAVNYFGFAQDLAAFESYAALHSATVIEDNAHGFLSKDSQGRWLGTRASYGIFSFRKTLPLDCGAGLYNAKTTALSQKSEQPSLKERFKLLIKSWLATLISLGILPPRLIARLLTSSDQANLGPWLTQGKEPELEVPIKFADSSKLQEQISSLETAKEILRRRTLYKSLHRLSLKVPGLHLPFGDLTSDTFTCPYMFVFIPQNDKCRDDFLSLVSQQGLRFVRWPDLPIEMRDRCPEFYKNVWAVPFMW